MEDLRSKSTTTFAKQIFHIPEGNISHCEAIFHISEANISLSAPQTIFPQEIFFFPCIAIKQFNFELSPLIPNFHR